MLVKPDRLSAHLARQGLATCYLLFGDEPLQLQESAGEIRRAAERAGVTERLVFDAATAFDWRALQAEAGSLSLFADRRLIEIRLGARKPDKAGAEILMEMMATTGALDIYLLSAEALDRDAQASAWFKAVERGGIVVPCRALDLGSFKQWLAARAAARGKELEPEAVELLALRAEGNLLAAAQEIEKLLLIVDAPRVSAEQVLLAVTDSARYDVFKLIDAAVAGEAGRAIRMLRGLREEGTEAVFIGWALNRELRQLARIAASVAAGSTVEGAFAEQRVWQSRQAMARRALARLGLARLTALLRASVRLDLLSKGTGQGDVWDELETLVLAFAGGPWLQAAGADLTLIS